MKLGGLLSPRRFSIMFWRHSVWAQGSRSWAYYKACTFSVVLPWAASLVCVCGGGGSEEVAQVWVNTSIPWADFTRAVQTRAGLFFHCFCHELFYPSLRHRAPRLIFIQSFWCSRHTAKGIGALFQLTFPPPSRECPWSYGHFTHEQMLWGSEQSDDLLRSVRGIQEVWAQGLGSYLLFCVLPPIHSRTHSFIYPT